MKGQIKGVEGFQDRADFVDKAIGGNGRQKVVDRCKNILVLRHLFIWSMQSCRVIKSLDLLAKVPQPERVATLRLEHRKKALLNHCTAALENLSQFLKFAPPYLDVFDTLKAAPQHFSQLFTGATRCPVTVRNVKACDIQIKNA
jgi:hypothetical protein